MRRDRESTRKAEEGARKAEGLRSSYRGERISRSNPHSEEWLCHAALGERQSG